mgnify:CR=1 FL=1
MTEQKTVATRAFNVVDTEYPAVIAELSVARLMKDKNPELSIIDTKTNKNILKTGDLIGYLNLLRTEKYADMPLQEYLDRVISLVGTLFIIILFQTRCQHHRKHC